MCDATILAREATSCLEDRFLAPRNLTYTYKLGEVSLHSRCGLSPTVWVGVYG